MPMIETASGALFYDLCDVVLAWIENPQTIVFHHGIAANTHIWAEWLPVLATRYRLVRDQYRALLRDQRYTYRRDYFVCTKKDTAMNIHLSLAPLVSLLAGILILIVPRLLSYIVAAYLIVVGILGLVGDIHLR